MIGAAGLGVETGYWYLQSRQLQHAADVAAHAAGGRKRAGDSTEALRAVAVQIATQAGYKAALGTLTLNVPPASGAYAADQDALEVRLTKTVPRLFTAMFNQNPVALSARAVALVRDGNQACVLALSSTASPAVKLSGSSLVDLDGCDLASNSMAADSILMNGGSASLEAGCVYAVGEAITTTRLTLTECESVKEFASVTADPYAGVAEPTGIACEASISIGATVTAMTIHAASGMKAMRFCGNVTIHGTVTFSPGIYIIDGGDFTANAGSSITGAGVTFFFANGAKAGLNGSATLNLSPPTSGPYSGLTFFGSRSGATLTHKVNGNSGSVVEGAVYFPASHVEFSGNSKTSGGGGCTQVIASTIELTGNSSLRSSCETTGTRDLLANRFVRLVE